MTDGPPSTGPAQLVVLGMHRSGTSGVTRLLNLAGAHFGPEGIATEPNEENPRGFWERRDVRAVCDGLLHGAGFDWWKLVGFDAAALPDDVVAEGRAAFAAVLEELDAHRPWVVKEPRLCVLYPVLAPLLDAPVFVHVTREPLEVARSMHRRDGFPMQAALGLWELYTVRAVEASAGRPRLLVRYEDLMADPVGTTARLVDDLAALGVAGLHHVEPDEVLGFISADLHRQHQDPALRRQWLNADQAELAARVDDGSILDAPHLPVSAGAFDALAGLERERDLAARLRQGELDLASQERRAADAARRAELDLASLERRFGDERHRLELDVASLERKVARAEARVAEEARYKDIELARRRALGRQAEDALASLARQLERYDRSRVGRVAANLVSLRQTVTPGASRTTAGPLTNPLAELAVRRAEIAAFARQEPAPGGTSEGLFPTDDPTVWRTRPKAQRSPDRPSMAVISWDVGHNPIGRANVLAEVLARRFDVELWGAQFERYGSDVWAPLRRAPTPVNLFPGQELPAHLRAMERVAGQIDADLIWVSKPRLPSYLLGLDAKLARNRPLVLDVDDHELAFFGEDTGLGIDDLLGQRGRDDLRWPFERDWTRLCDSYIDAADLVTVSNVALQDRYGGLIVPHARDERRFDPARFDREATRDRLGVRPGERLLLFGGTPRAHKGVVEVLEALERLGDDRYRVLMFGTREFDELKPRIGDLARWARVLPAQPFDDLPELVNAADLACVVQDPSHPVSRYQMPAKVSDALAMGVPCLVTRTPPLAPLADAGVLQVLEAGDQLHERIARVFDDPDDARARADRGRELFLREYSYEAVAERLAPVFDGLLADPPPVSARLRELAEAPGLIWKGSYDGPTRAPRAAADEPGAAGPPASSAGPTRPPVRRPRHLDPEARPLEPGATFDVAMFWKQNDSGIYGRRQDMVLQELARSGRVGTIVHFDNPISPEALLESYRLGRRQAADQRRLVATESVARVLRRRDEPGIHRHTFVFGGHYTRRLGRPHRGAYISHVRSVLAGHGVGTGARPLLVWAYPTNDDLPGLIDALAPDLVVADVVDDNRTWYEPGEPHYERVERNYEAVLARSDVVIANCEPVAESMARFAESVHVVPNGLELPGAQAVGPPPAALAALGRPLLAYVGNLSDRIDLALLEAVARARPRWNLVLVGSAHRDPAALALDRLPNVHVLGVMPYQQVRRLLAHVDVALIPHVDNEMTRSMNPLKAFVYASAGVPVVSTPVANLPDFGGLITVAEGAEGFVDAIEAHLAAGRPPVDLDLLRPHSWEQRVGQVFDLVDEALADRS